MIELTDKNFKQDIKDRKMVLVDFYAKWCGPCIMQSEVLERINDSRSVDCDIIKVNVDEAPVVASEYGIDAIPTLILFKDNKLVKRIVGYTQEEEIIKLIDEYND